MHRSLVSVRRAFIPVSRCFVRDFGAGVTVRNIPWSFSNDDLRNVMSKAGPVVSAEISFDGARSRGAGIVFYEDETYALKARQELDKHEVEGRKLIVRMGDKLDYVINTVYVPKLDTAVTPSEFLSHMMRVGTVIFAKLLRNPDGTISGAVEYAAGAVSRRAMRELNATQLGGSTIKVVLAEPKHFEEVEIVEDNTDNGYDPESSVYVGDINKEAKKEEIAELLSSIGEIRKMKLKMRDNKTFRGGVLVQFASPEQAEEAIAKLNDATFQDRKIYARKFRSARIGSVDKSTLAELTEQVEARSTQQRERTLRVANLSPNLELSALVDMVGPENVVWGDVAMTTGGRPRCTAYIELTTMESMKEAYRLLRGKVVEGRRLFVEPVVPMLAYSIDNCVVASNLRYSITDTFLAETLSAFGPVKSVKLLNNKEGRFSGSARVEFESAAGCKAAVEAQRLTILGRDTFFRQMKMD